MKKRIRRIWTALLAAALLLSAAGIAEAARPLGITLDDIVKSAKQGRENVLMADGYESYEAMISGGGTVLGSDIPRESIASVRFADSISGRGEDAWDASAAGDGSVLAWTEPDGDLLALTIAGEGGVKLNPDCGQQFANYVNLTSFELNGCVDGSGLDNLCGMFYNCAALEELDLSGLESSKGTDFSYMFALCSSLQRLDISNLDTRNGEFLSYMFYMASSMRELEGELWCPDDALYDHIYAGSALLDSEAQLMHDSPSEDELARLSDFIAGKDVAPGALGHVLGSDIPRAKVRSVRFVNGLAGAPEDAWDVSTSGKGMVLAWTESDGDLYDLTIGSLHELTLGVDMKNQFANYVNLEEFIIEGGIDASHTLEFDGMFSGCRKLTELDLSKFETFCAEAMPRMFEGCASLRRLDIRNFDVRRASNLDSMFAGTAALEEVVTGDNFLVDESASYEGIFDGSGYVANASTEGGEGAAAVADEGTSSMDAQGGSSRAPAEIGVLRADPLESEELDEGGGYVLGSDIPRAAVRSIRFVADMDGAPGSAWDASESGDGSVLAWAEPNGEMYDLTIAGGAGVALSDGTLLFANYSNLEYIDFGGCVDTSRVTAMSGMFCNCGKLKSLDLSGFDTANVTRINLTFFGCQSLKQLDVSGFDTRGVTNMAYMFAGCEAMERLDLSSFDTSSVTNASYMFVNTKSLDQVALGEGFVLGEGVNAQGILENSKLAEGDGLGAEGVEGAAQETAARQGEVPEQNVLRVYDPDTVLGSSNCPRSQIQGVRFAGGLTNAPSNAWDVSASQNGAVKAWFDGAKGELIIAGEGGVRLNPDTSCLFADYPSLEYVHFDGWVDASDVTNMRRMFRNCAQLKEVDLSELDTSHVTSMSSMFEGCASLTALDLSSLDTSKVTDMGSMFGGCASLTALDLSSLDTSNVTDMNSMFNNCSKLQVVDVSGFNTAKVMGMSNMFSGCSNLTALNLQSFNTGYVRNFSEMFSSCRSLETIWVSDSFVIQEYRILLKVKRSNPDSKSVTSKSNSPGSSLKPLAIKNIKERIKQNQNQNQNQQGKKVISPFHSPDTDQMFSECNASLIWRGQTYSHESWTASVTIKLDMKRGDKGSSVKWLQKMLIYRVYLPVGSDDGTFGAATEQALRRFQSDHALEESGIADRNTLAQLRQ